MASISKEHEEGMGWHYAHSTKPLTTAVRRKILAVPGVEFVNTDSHAYKVRLTKANEYSWVTIDPAVLAIVEEHEQSDAPMEREELPKPEPVLHRRTIAAMEPNFNCPTNHEVLLYALADDDTEWRMEWDSTTETYKWVQLPSLPQPE